MRRIALFLAIAIATFASAQKIVFEHSQIAAGLLQNTLTASCRDSKGNFYMTGTASSGEALTQKVSSAGAVLWTNTFSDGAAYSGVPEFVAVNAAGDTFVAGALEDFTQNVVGMYASCITSAGSTLWTVKDLRHFAVDGLALSSTGDPIIAAQDEPLVFAGLHNFDLIRYSATTGAVDWKLLQSQDSSATSCRYLVSDAAGHLYGLLYFGNANTKNVIAYDEIKGKALWTTSIPVYAPLQYLTPQYLTALPSGDVLVTGYGNGQTSGHYWVVVTLDRLKGSTGSFVFRKVAGPESGVSTYIAESAPTTDSLGNVYWSGLYEALSEGDDTWCAGKSSPAGIEEWIAHPSTARGQGISAVPSAGGGAFALYSASANTLLSDLSSSGSTLWTKPVSFGLGAKALSVANNDPSVCGVAYDAGANQQFCAVTLDGGTGASILDKKTTVQGDVFTQFDVTCSDSSGNVYAAGIQGLFVSVSKYSPAGALLWTSQINPTNLGWQGYPNAITYSNGHVFVAAVVGPNNGSSLNLGGAVLNAATGAVVAGQIYVEPGYDYYAYNVAVDSKGNVIVAGSLESTSTYTYRAVVTKFAAATGDKDWEHIDATYPYYSDLVLDSQDSVILSTGDYQNRFGGSYVVTKYNWAGSLVFTKTQTSTESGSNDVAVDPQRNVYEATFDVGKVNLYKYNDVGIGGLLKTYTVPQDFQDDCQVLYCAANSSVYIGVGMHPYNGANLIEIWRVNPTTGAQAWTNTISRGNGPFSTLLGPGVAYVSIDAAGNVTMVDLAQQSAAHPSDIAVQRLAAATGKPKWTYTYAGAFASPGAFIGDITTGPDLKPVIVGATPSALGPLGSTAFLFKVEDPMPDMLPADSGQSSSKTWRFGPRAPNRPKRICHGDLSDFSTFWNESQNRSL